jgi:hypothetical protein
MELLIGVIVELLTWLFAAFSWDRGESPERSEKGSIRQVSAPIVPADLRTRESCAFCRNQEGNFVACRKCRAPHHADCARLNRRCAVFGCGTREFRAPAA